MILIVGSDNDDIAYIVKSMEVDRTDIVAGKYEVNVGHYAGRDICIVATGYGQEMATLVTGLLIERYSPYIVISIGAVQSISPGLKRGDLYLASRVYSMDVNLMGLGEYKYGQIPEQPPFFVSDSELKDKIKSYHTLNKTEKLVEGVLLSSNTFHTKKDEVEKIRIHHFAKVDKIVACDTETAGVCCSAALFEIPVLVLKGCSFEVDEPEQRIERTRHLVMMSPVIGKLLESLLDSLGR